MTLPKVEEDEGSDNNLIESNNSILSGFFDKDDSPKSILNELHLSITQANPEDDSSLDNLDNKSDAAAKAKSVATNSSGPRKKDSQNTAATKSTNTCFECNMTFPK